MSSSLSRSTIDVLQLSCCRFLTASSSRWAVTSTIATGCCGAPVVAPDEELPVVLDVPAVPGTCEAWDAEPAPAEPPCGADCCGLRCCVVGGRDAFDDLRRPS